jgi:hypothetical protein
MILYRGILLRIWIAPLTPSTLVAILKRLVVIPIQLDSDNAYNTCIYVYCLYKALLKNVSATYERLSSRENRPERAAVLFSLGAILYEYSVSIVCIKYNEYM